MAAACRSPPGVPCGHGCGHVCGVDGVARRGRLRRLLRGAVRPRAGVVQTREARAGGRRFLESFAKKSCAGAGTHEHCRQAYLTLGHAYEKREAPGKAWAAYDSALTFGPHSGDDAIGSDRDWMREMLDRGPAEGDRARPGDHPLPRRGDRGSTRRARWSSRSTSRRSSPRTRTPASCTAPIFAGSTAARSRPASTCWSSRWHTTATRTGIEVRPLARSQGLALQQRRANPGHAGAPRLRRERRRRRAISSDPRARLAITLEPWEVPNSREGPGPAELSPTR